MGIFTRSRKTSVSSKAASTLAPPKKTAKPRVSFNDGDLEHTHILNDDYDRTADSKAQLSDKEWQELASFLVWEMRPNLHKKSRDTASHCYLRGNADAAQKYVSKKVAELNKAAARASKQCGTGMVSMAPATRTRVETAKAMTKLGAF